MHIVQFFVIFAVVKAFLQYQQWRKKIVFKKQPNFQQRKRKNKIPFSKM